MAHTLTANAVSHAFGRKQVLSDITIECRTGEVLAIFGRNGTGKSTLLKIVFGSMAADSAALLIDGRQVPDRTQMNRFVAYHHQEVFLPKASLVRDLIPLYFPDGEKQNRIFHEKQINRIENQKVGALSMGEQRYLQFILLLNLDHYFMLLDEPFSMVEPLYKDLIKEKIEAHRSQKGFIVTDHYYADVLQVASRKLAMADAKLYAVETESDLVRFGYLRERLVKRM